MKAILYTRVSTGEQVEHGTSLAEQTAACEEKAKKIGAVVVARYCDPGVSGARLLSRPGLQEALRDLKTGKADLLIIANLSRYSRDREHQSKILRQVKMAGGRLVFCDMDFDLETPEGEMAFNVSGDFAHYERKLIRDRTMKGKRRHAAQGRQPARARRPFGYLIVCHADIITGRFPADRLGTYEIIEEEAQWVRAMFHRYAQGASLNALGNFMIQNGVKTTWGNPIWRNKTVRQVLQNSVYKGQAVFGRTQFRTFEDEEGYKLHITKVPEANWQIIPAPSIIDEAVWNAVQERLARGRAENSGRKDRKYALSGLLRCPACGYRLACHLISNKRDQTVYPYYFCQRTNKMQTSSGITCTHTTHYSAGRLEGLVVKAIAAIAAHPSLVETAIRAWHTARRSNYDEGEVQRLSAQLRETEAREQKVVELQIGAAVEGVDGAIYTQKLRQIGQEKAVFLARLEDMEAAKHAADTLPDTGVATILAEVSEEVCDALTAPELTGGERYTILTRIIDHILPEDKGLRIWFRRILVGHQAITLPFISAKSN